MDSNPRTDARQREQMAFETSGALQAHTRRDTVASSDAGKLGWIPRQLPVDNSFTPRKDHILTLDGLRGIAVLLVVWRHLPTELGGPLLEALTFAIQPGYLGVDIFFVLSGFLITRILLADRAKQRPLRYFLMRRALRIFPVYYLTIFILLLAKPGMYLLWCATYLSNFFYAIDKTPSPMEHTWSLAVEEHFYLFWPFVIYLLPLATSRRVIVWGIFPFAILLSLATAYFEPYLPEEADSFIYRLTFFRILSLGLGALFAYGENQLRASMAGIWKIVLSLWVLAILIIPTVLLVPHQWVGPFLMVGFTLLSGSIVLSAIALNDYGRLPARLLTFPALTYTGRISYSLYLFHVPIFFALGVRGYPEGQPPSLIWSLLAVGIAFAASAASFHWVERPLLQLKERFS
jgi:peptidoglycan/LPS O-acetylase OafA/YrhL